MAKRGKKTPYGNKIGIFVKLHPSVIEATDYSAKLLGLDRVGVVELGLSAIFQEVIDMLSEVGKQ